MTRVLITGSAHDRRAACGATRAPFPCRVLGGSATRPRSRSAGFTPTSFSWDDSSGWAAPQSTALTLCNSSALIAWTRPTWSPLCSPRRPATPESCVSERGTPLLRAGSWALRGRGAVRESGHVWTMLRPSCSCRSSPTRGSTATRSQNMGACRSRAASDRGVDRHPGHRPLSPSARCSTRPRRAGYELSGRSDHVARTAEVLSGAWAGPQPRGDHDRGRRGRHAEGFERDEFV